MLDSLQIIIVTFEDLRTEIEKGEDVFDISSAIFSPLQRHGISRLLLPALLGHDCGGMGPSRSSNGDTAVAVASRPEKSEERKQPTPTPATVQKPYASRQSTVRAEKSLVLATAVRR